MPHRTPFVKVPLTRGKVALVSPKDAERVLEHSWHALRCIKNGRVTWKARASFLVRGKKTHIFLHRFILGFGPGDPQVDHKNGNDLDCRRGNMREATHAQNQQNRRKRGKMPYRGICPKARRWTARIEADKKLYRLGHFATAEEAARAYDEAARRLHGEFACLNFPREGERGAV